MRGSANFRQLVAGSIGSVTLAVSAGPAAAICVVGIDPSDRLQMREGPGVRNRPVGAIPAGACDVTILGCRGRWCQVTWRGQTGWSNSTYLGWLRPPTPDELARQRRLDDATDPADIPREPPRGPEGEPNEDFAVTPGPDGSDDQSREAAEPPAKSTTVVPNAARPPAEAPLPAPAPRASDRASPPEKPASSASTELSNPTKMQKAAPTPGSDAELCVSGVDEGDTLKVRTGPGAKFALRYGFTASTCGVKITGACESGWCPVDYRGYKGWAEQAKLKPRSK